MTYLTPLPAACSWEFRSCVIRTCCPSDGDLAWPLCLIERSLG